MVFIVNSVPIININIIGISRPLVVNTNINTGIEAKQMIIDFYYSFDLMIHSNTFCMDQSCIFAQSMRIILAKFSFFCYQKF